MVAMKKKHLFSPWNSGVRLTFVQKMPILLECILIYSKLLSVT